MRDKIRSVLVVDDDLSTLWTYSKTLELAGFRVLAATDGETGLDVLLSEQPDLALVDLRMPGIGGLEVLAVAHQQAPDIPVVILTSFDGSAAEWAARRLGAVGFAHKPWQPDDLIELVQSFAKEPTRSQGPDSVAEPAYATQRWVNLVVGITRTSNDVATVKSWLGLIRTSEATLRRCCDPFDLTPAKTLDFARSLRLAVRYSDRVIRFWDVLDIQDDLTMSTFLARSGFRQGRPVPTVSAYLQAQHFVADTDLLRRVERELDVH